MFAVKSASASPAPTAQDKPPPVLFISNILPVALCRALIALFEASPHQEGGVARCDPEGHIFHNHIDETTKKRRDWVLTAEMPLYTPVFQAIERVCLPQLRSIFHFHAAHMDRLMLARYDEGGFFTAHRDNSGPSGAFRQFALSINLNAADYTGGQLRFPDYGSGVYKPATGDGVIFSASLLHEAVKVEKGRRYALLTFLHNAQAEILRQALLQQAKAAGAVILST